MKRFIVAAAMAAVLTVSATAQAADLGGNCCADLEKRISELEATVAKKGNRKVSLEVYGQVNQAILWVDHGIDDIDDTAIIDNQANESRFGFKGSAKVNSSLSAGYQIEIGLDQKTAIDSGFVPAGDYGLSIRHAFWWIENEAGRISVGQTSTATDGLDTVSFANIGAAVKLLSIEPVGLAYMFGADLPFDGTRERVVKYTSPTMAGFVVSAAWQGENQWDAALRYAGEFGDIKFAGGAGFRRSDEISIGPITLSDVDNDTITVSAAFMHTPTGLFINGMWADMTIRGYHVIGGAETKINSLGKTTFFAEYAKLEIELGSDGIDPSLFGFGIVQAIDSAAMDLYVTWRQHDLDVDGADKINSAMAGARIKF